MSGPRAAAILDTHALTRRFGALVAVDAISISVRPGQMFGLLGSNGAGKTTAIKMLTTLLPPTSGTATVAGFDICRDASRVRRSSGYVPQMTSAYQWVCFPIYGIVRVPRRTCFVFDRRTLAYLNGVAKVTCTFCSYANGLIAYVREVAARTERYWCPIKHAHAPAAPHARYHRFFDYGDAERDHGDLVSLRGTLRRGEPDSPDDGARDGHAHNIQ